jgi:hypothetical protein
VFDVFSLSFYVYNFQPLSEGSSGLWTPILRKKSRSELDYRFIAGFAIRASSAYTLMQ